MVKSIQRIEQELAAIAEQVDTLKTASCDRYEHYLRQLSQSIQRQLVTAAYQICTQSYPDEFLALTYTQRQELQQVLRQIGRQSEARLLDLVARPALQPPKPSELPAQLLSQLPLTKEQLQLIREKLRQRQAPSEVAETPPTDAAPPDASEPRVSDDPAAAETTSLPPEPIASEPPELESADPASLPLEFDEEVPAAEPRESIVLPLPVNLDSAALTLAATQDEVAGAAEPPEPLPLDNPERLAQWFSQVEDGIAAVLQAVSSEANRRLQAAAIFATNLPPKVLDAAISAEESSAAMGNSPNLLNLLIEAEREGDDESRDATVLQVTAICLRLPEIEFAAPALMAERQQLRELVTQANKLSKQYQKLQRERAIAAAEAAWRAGWTDD